MIEWLREARVVAFVECRLQVTGATWRLATVLSVILAAVATASGVQLLQRQHNEVSHLESRRADMADHGRHVVSGFQRDEALRLIRPISLPSVLVRTREGTQFRDPGPEGLTHGSTSPQQAAVGDGLDLDFILRGIIGLLAVVVGGGSLVVARHQGTTKSLVSLPVRPTAMVAGALIGGLAAISLAAASAVLAALVAFALSAQTVIGPAPIGTAALLWIAVTALGAALQGLGAIAALRAQTAAGALAGAVVVWLLVAIIGIPIINAVVPSVAPVTSRALFEGERLVSHRHLTAATEFAAGELIVRTLGPSGIRPDTRLDEPLLSEVNDLWNSEISRLRTLLNGLEANRRNDEANQARWTNWLSMPLPGALFQSVATELAGVGLMSDAQWDRDTDSYQRALNEAVFDARPRINFRVRREAGTYSTYFHDRAPRPTVADLPTFVPHRPTLRTRARSAAPPFALLGFHAALSWLGATLIFIRRQSKYSDLS